MLQKSLERMTFVHVEFIYSFYLSLEKIISKIRKHDFSRKTVHVTHLQVGSDYRLHCSGLNFVCSTWKQIFKSRMRILSTKLKSHLIL